MNYQAIRAAFEAPLSAAFTALSPAVPIFFDNATNTKVDSVDEFVHVNLQFGITNEATLTNSVDHARGVIVIRIYTPKDKGPARNQTLITTAVNVFETINATPKPATGVYARTGAITGPDFGLQTTDQQSRRSFTPFFVGRVETPFQATILP